MSLAETFGPVRVRAPGKINVFLEVGCLQDDGYHELATAFQALSLFEEVVASHADGFSMAVTGTVALDGVPVDDRNLALRAARLLATETGYPGGVHLDVHKQVPVAGGMGGGSADAAAALVACDALWETGLSSSELHRLAARLGADVPFALMGGTAIGAGRGDRRAPAVDRGREVALKEDLRVEVGRGGFRPDPMAAHGEPPNADASSELRRVAAAVLRSEADPRLGAGVMRMADRTPLLDEGRPLGRRERAADPVEEGRAAEVSGGLGNGAVAFRSCLDRQRLVLEAVLDLVPEPVPPAVRVERPQE